MNGHIQFIVAGQLALDASSTPAGEALQPGLWTWGAAGAFGQVRLYSGNAGSDR